jgi:DNA-directed RNA polymerase subunit RPC12/RpoP
VVFAEWAKWCGYITANQYNSAVHRQNSELQAGGKARPIHEVMVSLGHMNEEKANGLLGFLAQRRPDSNDEDFVSRVLRQGGVDKQEVQRICGLQREMAGKRNEVSPIGQLLVQNRIIPEARMLELLQEQAKDGTGSLRMALAMSQPAFRESAVGSLTRQVTGSPHVVRNAIVLSAAFLAVFAVWAWALHEPQATAYGRCATCNTWVAVPWTAAGWPARCPRCGTKGVMFAVMCPRGHVFLRDSPFGHEACPECRSDFGRPLTREEFLQASRESRPSGMRGPAAVSPRAERTPASSSAR